MNTNLARFSIRLEKDIIVRIHRSLRGKGVIKVAAGQEVTPDEIIGNASVSLGFRIINLADALSVAPADVAKYLKKSLGQRIYKGELLALKEAKLFGSKRLVTSPTDGVLDFLNPKTGELRMTFIPKKADLPAGVFGVVEEVDKARGQVVIRTQVTRIYGMFGSGRTRDGILHILNKRDNLITKEMITGQFDENILVGGSLIFKDAISAAISEGVNGIITGGVNAKDYKAMAGGRLVFPKKIDNDIGISVMVCEGFGSIPIGEDIFKILALYEGKFVSLDGNSATVDLPSFESKSLTKVKNTRLPPLSQQSLKEEKINRLVEVKLGMYVRIIGNAFLGEQGKVVAIDGAETTLPSGIKSNLLTVETKRRKIQVPVANIEVMDYSR